MILGSRIGRRLTRHAGYSPFIERVRHWFGIGGLASDALQWLGVGADTANSIGTIAGPALVGAGGGAALGAATGNSPLAMALGGGALGGVLGGFGVGTGQPGVLTQALGLGNAGTDASLLDSNGNAITPPTPPGYSPGTSYGNMTVDANGNLVPQYNTAGVPVTSATAASPSANQASNILSGSGNLFGGKPGGVSNTSLALGALAALGSMFNKPQVGTWATPGPASNAANTGPYFNQPLNTTAPGRQAVTTSPFAPNAPNYWQYGGPEQNYFQGNNLANFGFARGGALNRHLGEFTTARNGRHVSGPGTGISDDVPARLSDGEYVLTADDVARIGGGSNERGARMLDRDRKAIAKAAHQPQFPPKGARKSLYERAR